MNLLLSWRCDFGRKQKVIQKLMRFYNNLTCLLLEAHEVLSELTRVFIDGAFPEEGDGF